MTTHRHTFSGTTYTIIVACDYMGRYGYKATAPGGRIVVEKCRVSHAREGMLFSAIREIAHREQF